MATKYLVQHRRGTATQWAEQGTLIPREGEIVIEIDEVNSLHKLKIGDGVHTYAELAYLKAGDEIVTQVLAEAKPRVITVELSESWAQDSDDKYYQTLTLDGITNHSRLDLQPSVDMLAEFKQLGLVFVTENNSGVITVYSVGNMPQKAYTMQATIVETECDGEDACIIGAPIGTPVAQSNWAQTDNTKADFIKNKPTLGALAAKDEVAKTDLASDVQEFLDGLASEDYVGSAIGTHNTATDSHNDIRTLISDLSTAVNNFLDVDDTTTDQLSEVLDLINNNKGTLESLTTNKVNVTDIIDNLTTNVANKPLSAAQGVALKALIDGLEIPTIPPSLPANGGNADTVDGKHASDFAAASEFTSHINNKSNPHEVTAAQAGAVEKTTYEYNKELAIGESGKVCIGKFPMYDSNITVEINSTTDNTYHGTLVIATQNINESLGGIYRATVYGDATNSLTDSIKIEYLNGSRVFSVYINLPSWSKNLLHIQCVALRSIPTDIATLVEEIPSTATIVPTNALKVKFDSLSSEVANLKTDIGDINSILDSINGEVI